MQDIKPHTWLRGKIVEIKLRDSRYKDPYADIYFRPITEGINRSSSRPRLSIPNSDAESSYKKRLIKKLGIETEEELIGKELYFKYWDKPNPKDNNHYFKIINPQDVLTCEEYNLDKYILELINSQNPFNIGEINKKFQKISKRDIVVAINSKRLVEGKRQLIKFMKGRVSSPVCEIDLKSFYPNIVIANKFSPQSDIEGIFLNFIKRLVQVREKGFVLDKSVENAEELKKLANSFIGDLNNEKFIFYDPELYFRILGESRRILERVVKYIERIFEEYKKEGKRFRIIKIHTDGIYFEMSSKICREELVPKLNEFLKNSETAHYHFEYKGYYRRGIFRDNINFALLTPEQQIKLKGTFFNKGKELVEAFLKGCYPVNFEEYKKLKKEFLKKSDPKIKQIISYLDFSLPPLELNE